MPAYHFQRIEAKWRAYWERNKTFRTPDYVPGKPKLYVLDMFPYPSGEGLHVGHPEGYTATDILCRYKRMRGYNVLHPMGWDAFGLPAEQYAVRMGVHPRETTRKNIDNFRRQIQSLGFSYDWDREIDTTDPEYYRWTQWIFLKLFDTWYDPDFVWTDEAGRTIRGKGRPIAELPIPEGVDDVHTYRDARRLAYRAQAPVNWCPELGTVLANEEVIDGKSEIGGHPVVRMPLNQWMLRITAYADRLVEDLELVDWPRAIKDMQRNWVGKSEGAEVDFPLAEGNRAGGNPVARREWSATPDDGTIRVFTTRPDTLFGATYMVLAPEHALVERITTADRREAIAAYRHAASLKSDLDRTDLSRTKTGEFTGAYAINPTTREPIPIWIADYVLMGYGTGAIMAVPGHDERDFAFAIKFGLPIRRVVAASLDQADSPLGAAFVEAGIAVHSSNDSVSLNGMDTNDAKRSITAWLADRGLGRKAVNYKLRDWLFSRQRYWGEPFPILLGEDGSIRSVDETELPVLLPDLADFKPSGRPEPPLGKAVDWVRYSDSYRRETNTMPQWAGSCWYYLRYIDPHNLEAPWDKTLENQWMPVDLYVGGAEHAVLHLLYSRFWHKALYDRGLTSGPEPFHKLVNQGMILGETEYTAYRTESGKLVSADCVEDHGGGHSARTGSEQTIVHAIKVEPEHVIKQGDAFVLASDGSIKVDARAHKMSKTRGNVVNPDSVVKDFGADSLRLFEMFMGPLEAVKPWSMKGVEGVYRFLGRAWRMIVAIEHEDVRLDPRVQNVEPTPLQAKITARTIAGATEDIEAMRFNTAISKLMEFVNAFTGFEIRPKSSIEAFTLLLSPFAPHLAEELWELLGHQQSLAYEPWPDYDPKHLIDETIEIPVQINGKLRGRVVVAAGLDREGIEIAARNDPRVASLLDGKTVKKAIVVPGKLVNFVVSEASPE